MRISMFVGLIVVGLSAACGVQVGQVSGEPKLGAGNESGGAGSSGSACASPNSQNDPFALPEPTGEYLCSGTRALIPGLPVLDDPEQPHSDEAINYDVESMTERYGVAGPTFADVVSNRGPTNSLGATLQSLAFVNPHFIEDHVKLVGQTSKGYKVYEVTVFDMLAMNLPKRKVLVDDQYPTDPSGNPYFFRQTDEPIWPTLYMKAAAVVLGSYDAIQLEDDYVSQLITGQEIQLASDQAVLVNAQQGNQLNDYLTRYTNNGYIVYAIAQSDDSVVQAADPNVYVQPYFYCIDSTDGSGNKCVTKGVEYSVFSYDAAKQTVTFRNPYRVSYGTGWNPDGTMTWPLKTFTTLFNRELLGPNLKTLTR